MRRIFSTVRLPHEPALTVESLAITQTVRPSMRARAGDHAVGGELGIERVGERGVLDEAARVDEQRDPLAREELALLGVLLVVLGRAARSTSASFVLSFSSSDIARAYAAWLSFRLRAAAARDQLRARRCSSSAAVRASSTRFDRSRSRASRCRRSPSVPRPSGQSQ